MVDLTFTSEKDTSIEEIDGLLKKAADDMLTKEVSRFTMDEQFQVSTDIRCFCASRWAHDFSGSVMPLCSIS